MSSLALTRDESNVLARKERIIEKGLGTFREVGQALLVIRDAKLYREGFATFADYCEMRWKFSDSRARQLIAAAKTAETVMQSVTSGNGFINERATRDLSIVAKKNRQPVLDWATEKADGAPITAKAIREAAAEVAEGEPDEDEDVDVAPVVDVVDSDSLLAASNNAAFFIQDALSGGEWINNVALFRKLNRPEIRVRSWVNESSVPGEIKKRLAWYGNQVKTDVAANLGDQIIRTTLNAMVWLGVVSMRLTASGVPKYRLADAPAGEEADDE